MTNPFISHRSLQLTLLIASISIWGCSEKVTEQELKNGISDSQALATPHASTGELTKLSPDFAVNAPMLQNSCRLEHLNSEETTSETKHVKKNSPLRLSGWVFDAQEKTLPHTVYLHVETPDKQQTWLSPMALDVYRSDITSIMKHFENQALT